MSEQPRAKMRLPLSSYEVFLISHRERKNLNRNLRDATKAGNAATLTIEQWRDTVFHFDWRCAYCQKNYYDVLEHFVPISLGGGTTADNCVPACGSCNVLKRGVHPLTITDPRIAPGIGRVKAFLDMRMGESYEQP